MKDIFRISIKAFTHTSRTLGVTAPSRGGFTLIEFVVIISIFAIVAGIGLFNIRGFQNDIGITNLAHDLALLIRRVQTDATAGVSQMNSTTVKAQGLWFDYDQGTGTFSPDILLFTDQDGSMSPDLTEVTDTIVIQTTDRISQVRALDANGSYSDVTGPFFIMFRRPFPEPVFSDASWQGVEFSIARSDGTVAHVVTLSGFGELGVQ